MVTMDTACNHKPYTMHKSHSFAINICMRTSLSLFNICMYYTHIHMYSIVAGLLQCLRNVS